MLEEEKQLKNKILHIENERKNIHQEIEEAIDEFHHISLEEQKYWKEYNKLELEQHTVLEEQQRLKQAVEHLNQQAETLNKTNVLNDIFRISHDGLFGTINGFRLGTLPPNHPVNWNEINAGLGQATFLLFTLEKQITNFTFSHYSLVPNGSRSKIVIKNNITKQKQEEKEKERDEEELMNDHYYELYRTNDYSLTQLFWYKRFDNAMVGFLACMNELATYIEGHCTKKKGTDSWKLPYPIENDKIGELSIRKSVSDDLTWTRALKHLLTDLKWMLAWIGY